MQSSGQDSEQSASKLSKVETEFSKCIICRTEKSKPPIKPFEESLVKLMTYLTKYKSYGDTNYTSTHYRLSSISVEYMIESNAFYHKDCYCGIVNERNVERALQR